MRKFHGDAVLERWLKRYRRGKLVVHSLSRGKVRFYAVQDVRCGNIPLFWEKNANRAVLAVAEGIRRARTARHYIRKGRTARHYIRKGRTDD